LIPLEAHCYKLYLKFIEDIVQIKADGIMATTVMKIVLEQYGIKKCDYIIPDRLNDGYGIKEKHVDKALEMGTEVIITVDNGISANNIIKYGKDKGLVMIVTDHHIPDMGNLPDADILINPHVTGDRYEHICGAFVALKLGNALLNINKKDDEYVLKDSALFAAVATISDIMPLIGENRLLVKYVLDNINYYKERKFWAGRTLKFLSGFGVGKWVMDDKDVYITEDTFGYYVGPTINASGRVNGETEDIISDIIKSAEYGKYINGYREINRERQEKTREIFKEHIANSTENIGFMVIDSDKYNYPIGGLIGLVANRISDKEQKPAFVGTKKDNTLSFSCRSVPGYSLYDGLNRYLKTNPDTTVDGGGHDGAIGIRIGDPLKDLQKLKEHFEKDYQENSHDVDENVFNFEDQYTKEIFDAHYNLAPYGKGFEKLKFRYSGQVTDYDQYNRILYIDNKPFRTFIYDDYLPTNGQTVNIIFIAMTDNAVYNQFKIEELEIAQEI
jgi:single-stranded-DNA-specific exonuclease